MGKLNGNLCNHFGGFEYYSTETSCFHGDRKSSQALISSYNVDCLDTALYAASEGKL